MTLRYFGEDFDAVSDISARAGPRIRLNRGCRCLHRRVFALQELCGASCDNCKNRQNFAPPVVEDVTDHAKVRSLDLGCLSCC